MVTENSNSDVFCANTAAHASKQGMSPYIRTADDQEYRVPSYHVDHIVDTVGAGDGFAVGFTSAILDGLSLEDAARRGAAIGAMAIQVAGDNEGLPTREQLAVFQQNA